MISIPPAELAAARKIDALFAEADRVVTRHVTEHELDAAGRTIASLRSVVESERAARIAAEASAAKYRREAGLWAIACMLLLGAVLAVVLS